MLASAAAIKFSATASPFTSVIEATSKLANKPALTASAISCASKEASFFASNVNLTEVLSSTGSFASVISTSQVAL